MNSTTARSLALALTLITCFQNQTTGQSKNSDSLSFSDPILDLGSNTIDGSATIACTGKEPYERISCHIYKSWISRPSPESYQKSRAALEADIAKNGDEQLKKIQAFCPAQMSAASEVAAKLKGYSPGRAAAARDAFASIKAICGCTTKQCLASTMLEQQTHEQNACTIRSSVIAVDFVRVNARKWVSTDNGPDGICGAVSVFSIEHEANTARLWTYTEQWSYTNNTEGLFCKGAKNEDYTFSWKLFGSAVQPQCEEFKFDTIPESR